MNYVVGTYVLYLVISVALTVWSPARCTRTDGSSWSTPFMAMRRWRIPSITCWSSVLSHEHRLRAALKYGDKAADLQQLLEALSTKVGAVLSSLVHALLQSLRLLEDAETRVNSMAPRRPSRRKLHHRCAMR